MNISNMLNTESIIRYCNNQNVNKEDLRNDLSEVADVLNKKLVEVEHLENIGVSMGIIDNMEGKINIKVTVMFKAYNQATEKVDLVFGKDLISSMEYELGLIVNGTKALGILNDVVKNEQTQCCSEVSIAYRWGNLNNSCIIDDWKYDKLRVRLNKNSMLKLIEYCEEKDLSELVKRDNWNIQIKKFIERFNCIELHSKFGISLGNKPIDIVLTENMLSVEDVLAVVDKNKNNMGIQTFKVVSVVKELGKFLVIHKWNVDYSRKKLTVNILDNKILDMESGKYITDIGICDRVLSRITLPAESIGLVLK